tara:strand:- start:149 stop:382 length:234 start_codon:yes stop_codon:yes gene_type:complete
MAFATLPLLRIGSRLPPSIHVDVAPVPSPAQFGRCAALSIRGSRFKAFVFALDLQDMMLLGVAMALCRVFFWAARMP